jgi:hypothetical protein
MHASTHAPDNSVARRLLPLSHKGRGEAVASSGRGSLAANYFLLSSIETTFSGVA